MENKPMVYFLKKTLLKFYRCANTENNTYQKLLLISDEKTETKTEKGI